MTRGASGGRCAIGAGLAAILAAGLACSTPRDSIIVDEGMIMVENQTSSEWRNIRITVNNHFGGGAPSLPPGGRLTAPLSQFETAYGQKFNRGRQSVFKVEITATDREGKPVTLKWGQDKQ
jgi:hypothetical protein